MRQPCVHDKLITTAQRAVGKHLHALDRIVPGGVGANIIYKLQEHSGFISWMTMERIMRGLGYEILLVPKTLVPEEWNRFAVGTCPAVDKARRLLVMRAKTLAVAARGRKRK